MRLTLLETRRASSVRDLGQSMQYRNAALFCCVAVSLAAFAQLPDTNLRNRGVKRYHDGGVRDIDAIGTRKIGCGRGFGNWYSLEHQIAMGKDYADQVEASSRLITDPSISEYINRIGQNLVSNSDSQVPFTIKVI